MSAVKKIVRYKPTSRPIKVGTYAVVLPLDHPICTNGGWPAATSQVIALHENGFETENTRYVLEEGE